MSSDSLPPAPPRPSVFISYASEDRAPTRLLREALAAAGLEVWYDENELGGGDAWDQKIRRQIRECTYFMPVVSATTERRREGYFRREWRLATERSLDMADDVMFLVPVVIDDISEGGARVPEKFLTVQWLRLPGGQPTAGLTALAQRLLAHDQPPPPPRAAAAPASARVPPRIDSAPPLLPPRTDGPPPMPPFPHQPAPNSGHTLKYLAEVAWWVITAAWLVFKRLPRWVRILLSIWIIITFFLRCSRDEESPRNVRTHVLSGKSAGKARAESGADAEDAAIALQAAALNLEKTAAEKDTSKLGAGFARAGAEIARAVSAELSPRKIPGDVVLGIVPFSAGTSDDDEKKVADHIFETVFGQLSVMMPGQVKPLPVTDGITGDGPLRKLAATAGENFLITSQITDAADDRVLAVHLLSTKDDAPLWSGTFTISTGDVSGIAVQITKGVVEMLAKRPAPPAPH